MASGLAADYSGAATRHRIQSRLSARSVATFRLGLAGCTSSKCRALEGRSAQRTKDLTITITSPDGRLRGGENSICVVFQKRETKEPVNVQNVSVEFTLLVGRIEEEPIRAQLTEDRVGRYCGHANLGQQYRVPASYYAFVFYTNAAAKKRKDRLFFSIR